MKHDMLNITKFLSLILAIMLILVSCGTTAAPADINVAVIKGPTGVGMAELMEKNSLSMYKVARGILGNDDDAADAIQDTILSCFEKIHTIT